MKLEQTLNTMSVLATAAITKNYLVGYNGAPCAAGAAALGPADLDQDVGLQASVKTHGINLVISGGVFNAGDALQSDAQARAIIQGAGVLVGRAVDPSPAAGTPVRMKH